MIHVAGPLTMFVKTLSGPDVSTQSHLCCGWMLSDLVAAAFSGLSAAPLVASPAAAVQTPQTPNQRPVLITPQQFGSKAPHLAQLQPGQRGRHGSHTGALTHPPFPVSHT